RTGGSGGPRPGGHREGEGSAEGEGADREQASVQDSPEAARMRDPRSVLVRPLMTEKSMQQKEELNTVTFEVAVDANKVEIRHAVEKVFNVKVADVRTQAREGKWKRMGGFEGRRRSWKKAMVTLAPGHKIERVEGAKSHGNPNTQADLARPAVHDIPHQRGDHQEDAGEEPAPDQGQPQQRSQRPRAHHGAAPGRRGQADASRRGLPPGEARHPGQGGGHRVRSEPLGAHRALALPRRGE